VVLRKLPGWVVSDEESVRADVARYVGMSPAALWHEVEDCARDAMWAVRASPVRALARLRADRK
jgi:hypothetical protein